MKRTAAMGQTKTSIESAERTARMVGAASRYGLHRKNCLEQSLVLWSLLFRQGISADLRIGVRKEGNELEAHAWVELDGLVLNDQGDANQHYTSFNRAVSTV